MVCYDEIEVVCPYCNKHFAIRLSKDKQGINEYRKLEKA
jgi:hypothetical protein